VAAAAIAGRGIPLWWPALRGEPAGGTARGIAALPGLPGSGAASVLVTLLAAVLLGLAGLWLGPALALHSRTVILEAEAAGAPDVEDEGRDVAVLGATVPGAGAVPAGVPGAGVPGAGVLRAGVPGAGVLRAGVLRAGEFTAAQVTGVGSADAYIPDVPDTGAGGGLGRQPGPTARAWGDD
jgi:hypothetical protein